MFTQQRSDHGQEGQQASSNGDGRQPLNLEGRTPNEVEALGALLMLGGQSLEQLEITAPEPAPPRPDHTNSPPPAPTSPTPSPSQPLTAHDVQAEMDGNLREFVTHALMTTTFRLRHYTRVAQVANRFGGRPHLQDALVSLDHADWDLGGAVQQLQHDAELRRAAAAAPPPIGRHANRGLDRGRASGGSNWDKNKLQLRISSGGRWMMRNYLDVDWSLGFNVEDPSPRDLLRLNRWRHRLILDHAGPPRPPPAGQWWHQATDRNLRRRIKRNLKKDWSGGTPDYRGIMEAHNKLFKGVKLPDETKEVPQRGYQQVAGTIRRHWKDLKYKKLGPGTQAPKGLRAIKKEEKKEAGRYEKTEKRDFSTTIEELDEVEKEIWVLESDWEEEETEDEDD